MTSTNSFLPLLVALAASAAPLAAQPAPPVALAPLRVTADLWESPLARIPASVSVFAGPALEGGAGRHFGDLVDGIPNFTWSGGTSRPRYFQIRGIGENSQYEGETPDSTVRFLIDDLDFTGLGTVGATFDLEQAEVLRGPQAGAFGANAAGGVVRLVTAAPTPFWTGQAEGTVGGDGLRAGGFALGGPLDRARPDRLMARLALYRSSGDGFRRNVTLGADTNARDELSARLRVTLNPAPVWRWEAALLYAEADNGFDEFALDNNGRRTFSNRPGRDEQQSLAGSLRGTFTGLPGLRLTSVTAGNGTKSRYSYDDDWTAASYDGFSDLRRERDGASQELRLDSAAARAAAGPVDRWTLGLFAARTDEASRYTNDDPENRRGLVTDYAARNVAAYGQAAHDFSPRTRLTAGLRWESLDVTGTGTRTRFRKVRGTFDPVVAFAPRFDDTLVGGKLALEHALTERHLGFVSLTRGYKGGGVNVDARINPPADPLVYGTETLWNWEAGIRGNWHDGRVTGEVTVFLLERRAAQVRDSAGFGGNYRFFTANANRARVSGLEAAGTWAFARDWSLQGSLGLMDSELAPFTLANGNRGGGRRLANTPPHGHTLALRYRPAAGFFAQAEWVGRAEQFDSNNQNEARRAFAVLHASAGWRHGPWTLTVWARNLADRAYDKRVFFFGNADPDYEPARYATRADPRQVGATLARRF